MADYVGTTGADVYAGTFEDDTIHDGGGGADDLSGGDGDDVITVTGDADSVDGGAGSDRLVVEYSQAVSPTGLSLPSKGGDFANGYNGVFDGTGANNVGFLGIEHFTVTYTGAGPVNVFTGDGQDSLTGGSGDDNLRSSGGIDTIEGGLGLDRWGADTSFSTRAIVINLNDDVSTYLVTGLVEGIEGFCGLTTGSGADRITGTAADLGDTVSTGAGDDTIKLFGLGADNLDGGTGRDRLTVAFHSAVTMTTLGGLFATGHHGTLNGVGAHDVIFNGMEDFTLSMTGPGVMNVLTGGGDDVLAGGDGADILRSGAGGDRLNGRVGDDRLDGGGDLDKLNGAAGDDTIEGGFNVDTLFGGGGDDLLYAKNDDDLDGSGDGDRMNGAAGHDTLVGSGGGDVMFGVAGQDALTGRGGDDTVSGGVGKDLIDGGLGADRLTGGADKDTFDYNFIQDSANGAEDLITDLTNQDVIALAGIDAQAGVAGDQAFVLVGAFGGHKGELLVAFHAAGDYASLTTIQGDVDGDALADFTITVAGDRHAFANFVL